MGMGTALIVHGAAFSSFAMVCLHGFLGEEERKIRSCQQQVCLNRGLVCPVVCLRLSISWHIGYHYSMGDWYRVVKTIKGHRYVYVQQTYREGGRVRTRNRYIGPAADGAVGVTGAGSASGADNSPLAVTK